MGKDSSARDNRQNTSRASDKRHWRERLPAYRPARIAVGVVFIFGGFLGALPILGFWMLPLGILILSIDIPFVRRMRRRFSVWYSRKKRR